VTSRAFSGAVSGRDLRVRRPALTAAVALIALTVSVVDQATKYLAISDLVDSVPVVVVPGWLQFRLLRNSGAAFSLATGSAWVFTVVAIVVSAVIVRTSRQLGSRWWAVGLGLLLGGALGNLVDRLFRAPGFGRGHVVDFIEYLRFPFVNVPVFNVADSCIVIAAGLIVVLGLRGVGVDGTRTAG
jgi:signal peptidase II